MKNFYLCFIVCFLTAPAFLSAQQTSLQQTSPPSTAQEIETLLDTDAVTYAQAARFVLDAATALMADDPDEAFRYAAERGWLPKKVAANDEARLDAVSLLFMRSFGISGGLMYSLAKSPRYAYRELVYLKAIQGRADPGMKVSGERLIFITNRILSHYE